MLNPTINNLIHDISLLQLYVQNDQQAGFSNMTRLLESLSIKIFGAAYGLNLVNKNIFKSNCPAIDLADDCARTAVQVTTNADARKIRHTLGQFEKNGYGEKYDHLYIFGFLKCNIRTQVPTFCKVVNVGNIISSLTDKNDEDAVQKVIDAFKQHTDFSRLHPYEDRPCLEIILGVIDRNAVKHRMCCEGSYLEMRAAFDEVTEVISKGKIGKKQKSKCIDEFYNESIKEGLRGIRDDIGKILAIVNRSRIQDGVFYNIDLQEMQRIDDLKISIMSRCNDLAIENNISISVNPI